MNGPDLDSNGLSQAARDIDYHARIARDEERRTWEGRVERAVDAERQRWLDAVSTVNILAGSDMLAWEATAEVVRLATEVAS